MVACISKMLKEKLVLQSPPEVVHGVVSYVPALEVVVWMVLCSTFDDLPKSEEVLDLYLQFHLFTHK